MYLHYQRWIIVITTNFNNENEYNFLWNADFNSFYSLAGISNLHTDEARGREKEDEVMEIVGVPGWILFCSY